MRYLKYFFIGIPVGMVVGMPMVLAGVSHSTMQKYLWTFISGCVFGGGYMYHRLLQR